MPARLVDLARPTRADLPELLALARSSVRLHWPWVHLATAPPGWDRWFERLEAGTVAGYLVRTREDGAIAGVVNLSEMVRGPLQSAYMGFYGRKGYTGRGLMSEGVALVLREAFTTLKLHRVEANIQPGNRPSRLLARRLGFRKEGFSARYLKIGGRWRDHERWALTVEGWRALRRR